MLPIFFFAGALALVSQNAFVSTGKVPLVNLQNNLDQDNSLQSNGAIVGFPDVGLQSDNSYVNLSGRPPAVVKHHQGSILELDCQATGRPAPTITWFRDNSPIPEFDDQETNDILDMSEGTIANAKSKLIVKSIAPGDKTSYTCAVQAGSKTAFATTIVHNVPGSFPVPQNLEDLITLNKQMQSVTMTPKATFSYIVAMNVIGSTIVLPCKFAGIPRPETYWMDNYNNVIYKGNPRYKTLASGELVIAGLRWEDMGDYTCVATNQAGSNSFATFVYPLKAEK